MIVSVEFSPIEFSIEPDQKLWDEANTVSREEYVKIQLRDYLEDNFEDLVNFSIKSLKIL